MALNTRQVKERDYFFGNRSRYSNKADGCLVYESIISDNEIIVQTDHVVSFLNKDNEVQFVLLIANNKCIYLNYHRQIKRVTRFENGKGKKTFLVKLNRSRFKPYYCKKYEGHDFETEMSFDGLFEEARLQGLRKEKVRMN